MFKTGTPVFVEVIDADANADPAVRETILVTLTTDAGDAETLRLLEDGRRQQYVRRLRRFRFRTPAVAHDCAISGGLHVTLTANYVDATDAADHAEARATLDPVSRVFVAGTGQPVDGASIVLLDGSGAPAHVSGDDGVSDYPATVVIRYRCRRRRRHALHVWPRRISLPVARAGHVSVAGYAAASFCVSVGGIGCVDPVRGRARRMRCRMHRAARRSRSRWVRRRASTCRSTCCRSRRHTQRSARLRLRPAKPAPSANRSPQRNARTVRRSSRRRAPVSRAGAIAVPGPVDLLASGVFGAGEPVFVVLTDPDQDLDPFAPDTVLVTAHAPNGDAQTLRLTETGASTGVFSRLSATDARRRDRQRLRV